jgi:hypothetical protein
VNKLILTIIFILTYTCTDAQTIKVLSLKHKKYFKEKDQFNSDSTLYILCEVCYNKPGWIDDEYCQSLTITVKDKQAFYNATILDIEKDTLILSCSYNRLSVWNWDGPKNTMSGKIKIISFTEDMIKLDIDVLISAKEKYLYKGTRIFKRTRGRL